MSSKERGKPRKASLFFRLVSAAVIGACSREQLPDPSAPIQIIPPVNPVALQRRNDKTTLKVTIRIENTSNQAILWSPCSLAVERSQYIMAMDRRSDEWVEVWRPTCPDEADDQRLLRSGESASIPLEMSSGPGVDFHGEVGVYRVRFFLSTEVGGEYQQLSPRLSISRPFSVVDPATQ